MKTNSYNMCMKLFSRFSHDHFDYTVYATNLALKIIDHVMLTFRNVFIFIIL